MAATAPNAVVVSRMCFPPCETQAQRFWVLRFRLMVKRGPWMRPQASEGEAQHGPFCATGRVGQGHERLHCGWHGQDHTRSEGGERTRSPAGGTEERCLPLQANWIGSWTAVAMAVQCAVSGAESADQQDGPRRRPWHGADDAGGASSPGTCKDITQEAADVTDPPQAAVVEGHRDRERSARHVTQLRP